MLSLMRIGVGVEGRCDTMRWRETLFENGENYGDPPQRQDAAIIALPFDGIPVPPGTPPPSG